MALWEAGTSASGIAKELPLSYPTVYRMLITAGLVETEEAKLFASGMSVDGISRSLGLSISHVRQRIPYPPDTPFLEYIDEAEDAENEKEPPGKTGGSSYAGIALCSSHDT